MITKKTDKDLNFKIHQKFIWNLLAIILIVILTVKKWSIMDVLAVFGDEFGYWGNAASIAGYNWKGMMSFSSYYSMGYSFLLVPIILFCKNTIQMYHAAIIVNIVLIIGSYLCAKYITSFFNASQIIKTAYALISVLNVSTFFQARIAWSETLLCFLMWLGVALMFSIVKDFKTYKLICIAFTLIAMIFVHQRTLPVVAIYCLILIYCLYKNKTKLKNIIIFLVLFLLMYIAYKYLKDLQIEKIYSSSQSSNTNNIDLNGGFIKSYIVDLLINFQVFLISFWSKFIITNISTFFMFLPVCKWVICSIKKKDEKNETIVMALFVVISCIAMVALSSLQMKGLSRPDLNVYSRYFDFTLGPVILLGFYCLLGQFKKYQVTFMLSVLLTLFSIGLIFDNIYAAEGTFNFLCSPIIGGILNFCKQYAGNSDKMFVMKITIKFICIIMVITAWAAYENNKIKKIVVIIMLLLLNYKVADYCSIATDSYRTYFREPANNMYLLMYNTDYEVYFVNDAEKVNTYNLIKQLQFLFMDKSINVIDKSEILNIDKNCWVISENAIENIKCDFDAYTIQLFDIYVYCLKQ